MKNREIYYKDPSSWKLAVTPFILDKTELKYLVVKAKLNPTVA